MTYLWLALAFVAVAAVVAVVVRRRTGLPRARPLALAFVALAVMTVVFDNLMIRAGLFTYGQAHLVGIDLGVAPVEDLSYPLAGVLLLPALWHLLGRRRRAEAER